MNSILIKLSTDDGSEFIGIKTYDRLHGSHGRFLVARSAISQLLQCPNCAVYYDSDCGNFLEIRHADGNLWTRITWINLYSDGAVKGFQQTFSIPDKVIEPLLSSGGNARRLCTHSCKPTTIRASPMAAKLIRNIAEDRHLRRAFSKAMRDSFNWQGESITLYEDGKYCFYFTTKSGFPKCGGLILHEGKRNGYPYVYYSVHT